MSGGLAPFITTVTALLRAWWIIALYALNISVFLRLICVRRVSKSPYSVTSDRAIDVFGNDALLQQLRLIFGSLQLRNSSSFTFNSIQIA